MAAPLRDPGPQARRALERMAGGTAGVEPSGSAGDSAESGAAPDDAVVAAALDVGAPGADRGAEADPATTEQPVEPLPDAPVGALEEWSLDQLHRRASEVGLEGRWEMSRQQLVSALREP